IYIPEYTYQYKLRMQIRLFDAFYEHISLYWMLFISIRLLMPIMLTSKPVALCCQLTYTHNTLSIMLRSGVTWVQTVRSPAIFYPDATL
ncbi:hypothetical protein, partial [Yersinia alsatica]|uniref:hypothetical protein n=1 Tax=Yersinia alsatica TaxID=2890317 RepID=UPI001C93A97F